LKTDARNSSLLAINRSIAVIISERAAEFDDFAAVDGARLPRRCVLAANQPVGGAAMDWAEG